MQKKCIFLVQTSIKVVAPVAFLLRLFASGDLQRGRRYQKQPQLLFYVLRGLQILDSSLSWQQHTVVCIAFSGL